MAVCGQERAYRDYTNKHFPHSFLVSQPSSGFVVDYWVLHCEYLQARLQLCTCTCVPCCMWFSNSYKKHPWLFYDSWIMNISRLEENEIRSHVSTRGKEPGYKHYPQDSHLYYIHQTGDMEYLHFQSQTQLIECGFHWNMPLEEEYPVYWVIALPSRHDNVWTLGLS